MNVVSVKINGVVYNLKGEENQDYLLKVAKYADQKMKDITAKINPNQIPRNRGVFEKDVMAWEVRIASLNSEYLLLPASRAGEMNSMVDVLNPIV